MTIFPDAQFADPSQYAMAWDAVLEVLMLVVLFAFAIERVLAQVFETPFFIRFDENFRKGRKKKYSISDSSRLQVIKDARYPGNEESSLKQVIASLMGILVAFLFRVDLFAVSVGWAEVSVFGCVLTGQVIAGGSKASIKLFQDVFNVKSSAYDRYKSGKSFSSQRPTPDALIEEATS